MRRARVLLTVLLSAALVFTGAGVAYGVWSTTASVGSTASTATVSVSHVLSGSGLAATYSGTTTAAVGVISVTNTGTRAGTYALALTATSTSSTMRAATTVEVGTAATCTTSATLTSAVTGNFSATVTKTGAIAAGASVVLCVRTSMTVANVTANASATLAASAASSITIGTWSASAAAPITFAQSVAAPTGFASVDGNRYQIFNQGLCISSNWEYTAISRNAVIGGSCTNEQTSNWRLTNDGAAKTINRAYNYTPSPANRWTANTATTVVLSADAVSDAQRWNITIRPDNTTYQIQNVSNSKCLAVASAGTMLLETCNSASAGQGFTFTLVADSSPAPVTLTCTGNGSNFLQYGWAQLSGYEAEVDYKLLIDGVQAVLQPNGYWPNAQVNDTDLTAAMKTPGLHTIQVQQSVSNAPWTVTGNGTMRIATGTLNMTCS